MLALIQISAHYATNLMDPAEYDQILADPQEVNARIYGSKIVIGVEQCMLISTWGVKICMLTLFWRLTNNLRLHVYVQIIAAYVAVGFVVIMITYYAVYCRPFSQYWAMPVQNMQCATYQNYSITQAVFNISSDMAMLAVPVPLLRKAQLRTRKKITLCCIMSLGLFTIISAILNKVFNFASPLTTIYQIWYIREASTAIYVANLICLWPLFRRVFGFSAFQPSSRQYRQQANRPSEETAGLAQSVVIRASSSLQSRPLFSIFRALHIGTQEQSENTTGPGDGPKLDDKDRSDVFSNRSLSDAHELKKLNLQIWEDDESRKRHEGRTVPSDLERGRKVATSHSFSLDREHGQQLGPCQK